MFIKLYLIFIITLAVLTNGCALVKYSKEISTLKGMDRNQKYIERYLAESGESLKKLINDIKKGRLKSGLSMKEILAVYGEPVLIKQPSDYPFPVFIYRHPLKHFDTDKVYLYFDKYEDLIDWEYKPGNQ